MWFWQAFSPVRPEAKHRATPAAAEEPKLDGYLVEAGAEGGLPVRLMDAQRSGPCWAIALAPATRRINLDKRSRDPDQVPSTTAFSFESTIGHVGLGNLGRKIQLRDVTSVAQSNRRSSHATCSVLAPRPSGCCSFERLGWRAVKR